MPQHRAHSRLSLVGPRSVLALVWWIGFAAPVPSFAQEVILHLRNGDRVSGTVVSANTNEVVLTNSYAGKMTISATQIDQRENVPAKSTAVTAPATKESASQSAAPRTAQAGDDAALGKPPLQRGTATPKPAPLQPSPAKTNSPSNLKKFVSTWHGELSLGLNSGFSSKDHQVFTGRLKATELFAMPDQRSLKNDLDYLASYGKTDGALVDNRMDGSWKAEYAMGKRFSIYNAAGAGYDEVRRIDLRFDVGPGVGYKWLTSTNFVLQTELGANYQQEYFASDGKKERYSLRVAEESWWQIAHKLRFDEKLEFFPEVDRLGEYRVRAESNLNYLFHSKFTLKLTVIDLYETNPAKDVSKNDLQILSSIGFKF